jgi:hypothetical protein
MTGVNVQAGSTGNTIAALTPTNLPTAPIADMGANDIKQVLSPGGAAFTIPVGAGLTTPANGQIGYDTTLNLYHAGVNGADARIASVVGSDSRAVMSSNISDTLVSTVPAAGAYRIGYYIYQDGTNVTNCTTVATVALTVTFNDGCASQSRAGGMVMLANGAGHQQNVVFQVHAGSGTAIAYTVTYTAGTGGTCSIQSALMSLA